MGSPEDLRRHFALERGRSGDGGQQLSWSLTYIELDVLRDGDEGTLTSIYFYLVIEMHLWGL